MKIVHFSDLRARTMTFVPRVRHAVACIHIPAHLKPHDRTVPIGLQLPAKAAYAGGHNVTSLQGGVERGEAPTEALIREAGAEYRLGRSDVHHLGYLISTLVPVAHESPKAKRWDAQWLHWYILQTRRHFKPDSTRVAHFAWYDGPDAVFDALHAAREAKLLAFSAAIAVALREGELPTEYIPFAELLRFTSSQAA